MDAVNDRHIHGEGTPEQHWADWPGLSDAPSIAPQQLVPAESRAVVVAPHPDDEVLGCGGLLAMLAAAGREVVVVAVTDGEGSHPDSPRWTPLRLAQQRRLESTAGWRKLGIERSSHRRLGFADGGLLAAEARLAQTLAAMLRPSDRVFATWQLDGHPDHEVSGRAAARACTESGARLIEMPIWMWHWAAPGDARVPWPRLQRVALDIDAQRRKRAAISAHRSQLEGDTDGSAAVLPVWALARLLRPCEYFFC